MPVPSNRMRGKWSGILALCSTDRDFERKVLPFLKLYWPTLLQCPPRQHWDQHGIDLVAWADEGPFPCVVQCKGFIERSFGTDQVRQIADSIVAFRNSPYRCEQYILAHNREITDRALYERVRALLATLVSEGKALRAEIWDRQMILRRAEERIQAVIEESIRLESAQFLDCFRQMFTFGSSYISVVPATEHDIMFSKDGRSSTTLRRERTNRDVGGDILETGPNRWTLLTGRFGSGKTTAALHAAAARDRVVFFIPCATLEGNLQTSLNEFLLHAVEGLGLFAEFDSEDRAAVLDLVGPTLAHVLRRPCNPYVLILDGLDEQRAYCRPRGLGILSNQLAELTCPVVLTTRLEHFHALFGSIGVAFGEPSTKFAPGRSARVLTLEPWGERDVAVFVHSALESTSDPDLRDRLSMFLTMLDDGSYLDIYGDLPRNPLFLQFILDDLAAGILQRSTQSGLLLRWVRRKLSRDIGSRDPFFDNLDALEVVDHACDLMASVAFHMTERDKDAVLLCENIRSDVLLGLAKQHFIQNEIPLVDVLLHSLLVPRGACAGKIVDIAFAFRIMQEYFLAAYLAEHGLSPEHYPLAIRALWQEITCADRSSQAV